MKLIEIAGMIPGIEVRRQQFEGNEAVSIIGPAKLVTYALKFALLTALVGIEQIARFGIKQDGTKVHLVLLQNPTVKLDKSQETAPIGVIEGYTYVHSVTAMDNSINVGLFDEGFDAKETETAKAFARLCDAIFASGKVRGADTNTLLLLGRAVKDRVLAAYRWAKIDETGKTQFAPLTGISLQGFDSNVRYATVKDGTILAIEYMTGRIGALNVGQITSMLDNGTVPEWQTVQIEGVRFEEVTPSIGESSTVALTVRYDNDERKLVLGHVRWTDEGDDQIFNFTLDSNHATDMRDDTAPVTRLTLTTVTAVDGNGGKAPRLQIGPIDDYDPGSAQAIRNMAAAATSGRAYRAASTPSASL